MLISLNIQLKDADIKTSLETWKELFQDKESRYAYMDDFLDSYLGMQIRVLREQREWNQTALGAKASMAQGRISLLESMEYSGWSLDVLRRLAKAFDLRLVVKFEDFGSYVKDYIEFDRAHLERKSFEKDVIFSTDINALASEVLTRKRRKRKRRRAVTRENATNAHEQMHEELSPLYGKLTLVHSSTNPNLFTPAPPKLSTTSQEYIAKGKGQQTEDEIEKEAA